MAMAILSLNPQFPQPNQMLLCTMMTTKSKIDSFFKFFNSNGPYYFVIISPIYLSPDLYAYLNRCLRSINNRAESTNSHIAILYDRDDTSRNTEFSKLFLSIQTNVFDIQKNNTSIQKFIQNFFKTSINQSSSFVISSHFIYTSKPRTGKTQYILKYILENNYWRKQNDYITTKLASKDDIWLHVKDFHGSHVILRTENKVPSQETINKCAKLAKDYSKASNSVNVPVDYTFVKNVRKPNGSKPGMVIYTNNKTIIVK